MNEYRVVISYTAQDRVGRKEASKRIIYRQHASLERAISDASRALDRELRRDGLRLIKWSATASKVATQTRIDL